MRCIIGTHVSHLHIRIVFGSLYQIGFHFKALARRRKTIAQITSAIIINFLHGTLHPAVIISIKGLVFAFTTGQVPN